MKTSDKELDALFAKLDDFAVEPSANLWQNIESELDKKPKKKTLVPALRIAAGIIVMLAVGLLFMRKQETINNPLPKKIAKVELQKPDPIKNQIKNSGDKNSMLLLSAKNNAVKTASAKSRTKPVVIKTIIQIKPKAEENVTETLAQLKQGSESGNSESNPNQTQIALVPDASVSLKPQPETEIVQPAVIKMQVMAAVTNPKKSKHKRIRNFGDVVNLVMAKVDKREDKLIQFTDSDDGDESNVTGINLGIINLKKEK
ncbi:MAG: hypothetical protein EOP42_12045 [Sphingobacteriaceae bacterium]|nr:MAG: hypothetical protein EOP42_12045 [Sphingobacteriaceae bacterium]